MISLLPLLLVCLPPLASQDAAAAETLMFDGVPVVNWEDAANYYDREAIVHGKIVLTRNIGEYAFLNFHPNFRANFTTLIQRKDIAAFPMILPGPGSLTRMKVEQALKGDGINFDVILAMDDSESIKRYVEIGMGVAVSNDFTLHTNDHYRLGVVRLDHIFPSSEIGVCTLKGKFLGRAVRNFIDTMEEDLRSFHPEPWAWPGPQGNAEILTPAVSREP